MGEDYVWPTWQDLLRGQAAMNGWEMPPTPAWWMVLPLIRHIRALRHPNSGSAHDQWMFNMIWWGYV